MKQIVRAEDDNLLVSIEDISQFSGVQKRAIVRTIRDNEKAFKRFGNLSLAKEITNIGKLLNEAETTFLLTLMKNTKEVVKFKSDLVFQFYQMKSDICDNNKKALYLKSEQLETAQQETQKLRDKRYGDAGDENFWCVHRFIAKRELDISKEELNAILLEENVITQKEVMTHKPFPKEPFSKFDNNTIVIHKDKMDEICSERKIAKKDDDQLRWNFNE